MFSGVGYVRNPKLRVYDAGREEFGEDRLIEGTFHIVALHGNVSLHEQRTIIHSHVIGTLYEGDDDRTRLLSGELTAGEVIAFEFTLDSIDDIRLYRADDESTGMMPWLHMDLGSGPPPAPPEDRDVPVVSSGPASQPPRPAKARRAPKPSPSQAPTASASDVVAGDQLQHPTLGECEVLQVDDELRANIRLSSGREVELHLGLLNLEAAGSMADGGTLYQVRIRRRR